VSKKKAPRFRLEKYLQVPANFRQLILEKHLSQTEILTFLLACEETVGKGRRAARLSNTDIAVKNGISERSAVRARVSLKEHGMLTVDVSENCWKTHESGLVSPSFPMIQAGDAVPEESGLATGATVTGGSSSTVTDDRGATVTDVRENHQDQLLEKNQEERRQADSRAAPRKTREANPASPPTCAANPKTKARKANPPAKTAGEEPPFSVEEEKPKADPKPRGAASPPPWTGIDVSQIRKRLSAFMEGEEPPAKLMEWICATFESVCPAGDVCAALEAAWNRSAAPGKKNAPRRWNWFYTTLRNALIPGEAARLPEQPAAPHPAHQATAEEMARGIDVLDSLVASYTCKCGAEIRQYSDRVVGMCTCGRAKPITRATIAQMPIPGEAKRRLSGSGRQ
jgi:hypothetical protein